MAPSDFQYYHYKPSVAAAAIFTVIFLLLSILHIHQMARTRTWYLIPFVIGGLCMLFPPLRQGPWPPWR